jgi:hypothetical protein
MVKIEAIPNYFTPYSITPFYSHPEPTSLSDGAFYSLNRLGERIVVDLCLHSSRFLQSMTMWSWMMKEVQKRYLS